jgi:hypothetical protein
MKTLKKKKFFIKGFTFIILCLIGMTARGQMSGSEKDWSNGADVEFIKNKTMIVILITEDENYVDKLTKKKMNKEIAEYKNNVKSYNTNIKELVPKYFVFPGKIAFKTFDEVKNMTMKDRLNSTFLAFNVHLSTEISLGGLYSEQPHYDLFAKDAPEEPNLGSFHFLKDEVAYCKMEIYCNNSKPKYGVTYSRTLPNDNLNKNSTEESIKGVYPYKFKIVSKEEFDNIILTKDVSACVLGIMPVDSPVPAYSQEILDLSSLEFVDLGSGGIDIKDEHLKEFAKNIK